MACLEWQGGTSLIHAAIQYECLPLVSLLAPASDLEAKTHQGGRGKTALIEAALVGSLPICQRLVELGADTLARDDQGATALAVAVHQGHIGIVQWLLSLAGADANTKLNNGASALYLAAQQGHAPIVALLLDAGANPELATDDNSTALWVACREAHVECVELLLNRDVCVRCGESISGDISDISVWIACFHAERSSTERHIRVVELLRRHIAQMHSDINVDVVVANATAAAGS